MNKREENADTNKNTKSGKKGMVRSVSVKQRTIVIVALLVVILVAAGLILYSVANAGEYNGVFVNGVRQVLL